MIKTETDVTETSTIAIEPSDLAKGDEGRVFKKLQAVLAEICKTDGVVGFTLKNSNQAAIDLDNVEELTEFALLSSQLFVSSEKLSESFDVGIMRNAVLEGAKVRILCLSVDGNQVSVIMEKNVDCGEVLKKILSKCGST